MNTTRYTIENDASAFTEEEILDPTARFGDWQNHVVFGLKLGSTLSEPTTDSVTPADTSDGPIVTTTRTPAADPADAPIVTTTRAP